MDEEKNEKLLTNFPEGSPELIRKNQTFKRFKRLFIQIYKKFLPKHQFLKDMKNLKFFSI